MTHWRHKIDLRSILTNDDISAEVKGQEIVKLIKDNARYFIGLDSRVIPFFEKYDSSKDDDYALFDRMLGRLYDFCAYNKIWTSG